MHYFFEDHGLPLVQLKERRRGLITGLATCKADPVAKEQLTEIAALQQAIAAMEAVICDLDAEIGWMLAAPTSAARL